MAKIEHNFKGNSNIWDVGDIIVVNAIVGMITFSNGMYSLTDLSKGSVVQTLSTNRVLKAASLAILKVDILDSYHEVKHFSGEHVKITLDTI